MFLVMFEVSEWVNREKFKIDFLAQSFRYSLLCGGIGHVQFNALATPEGWND